MADWGSLSWCFHDDKHSGLNSVPQNSCPFGTFRDDLIWEWGLSRYNLKWDHTRLGQVGCTPSDWCPHQKGMGHRDKQKSMWQWRWRLQWRSCKARNARDGQEPPEARKWQGEILPLSLQREHFPVNNLILNLKYPELWEWIFAVLSQPICGVCYCSPRKVIQQESRWASSCIWPRGSWLEFLFLGLYFGNQLLCRTNPQERVWMCDVLSPLVPSPACLILLFIFVFILLSLLILALCIVVSGPADSCCRVID